MIPADILTILILFLIATMPFVLLAGLGARIAARRARLVEPETDGHRHGDCGCYGNGGVGGRPRDFR